jgi:hypothetical protein
VSDETPVPKNGTLNAEHVMLAVEKAAEIFQCDAMDIIGGLHSGQKLAYLRAVAYARSHAAVALKELFDVPAVMASRACGVSEATAAVFLSSLNRKIKLGECPWFKQSTVDEIKQAVKEGMKE